MNASIELSAVIADLLNRGGFDAAGLSMQTAAVGGNNRLYRVGAAGQCFMVKQYFRHADDDRDRLGAEFAFLRHAAHAAPGLCPIPYACNPDAGLALYEFIEGRALLPQEIGAAEVDAAIAFIHALNAAKVIEPEQLPIAAEACFSIDEHLALVDRRVDRLTAAMQDDEAAASLAQRLAFRWQQVRETTFCDLSAKLRAQVLPAAQRIISPSDFGFHNALRVADGGLRFIDFEYAGWDDPAKTVGDFFHQLALPAPPVQFDRFAAGILPDPARAVVDMARIHRLRLVYGIKWCCIALNVFLPVHLARRRFADPALDEQALKHRQLAKAERLLDTLDSTLQS
jgi:thiamine kinase-like enzyme